MEDLSQASRRLNELKLQQEQCCLELENLQIKQNLINDFIVIKQLESEKKVLIRKLSDAKIRIRNLERNNLNRSRNRILETSLISTISEMKNCDISENDELICDKEIDFEDEYFDPEEEDLERVRPTPRLCPHYPLPHSMIPLSSRYIKRVGLWRESNANGLNSTLIDSVGQFTSVEDENVDWSQMTIFGDKFNTGRSMYSHGNFKKYQGYKQHFKERNFNSTHESACQEYPKKQNEADLFKPVVEKVVKKNIVDVLRRMSESSENFFDDCVCQRPASEIECSGSGCDYRFKGRLSKSCSLHPGDKYLMDHSGICPRCGAQLRESLQSSSTKTIRPQRSSIIPVKVAYMENSCQKDSQLKNMSSITITPVLRPRKR